MGREIVHCSGCGTRLGGADFETGGALRIDDRIFCSACAPQERPAGGPSTRSTRVSTRRVSRPSRTPRPGGLVIGASVAGAAVLAVLLAVALAKKSEPAPEAAPAMARPGKAPAAPQPRPSDSDREALPTPRNLPPPEKARSEEPPVKAAPPKAPELRPAPPPEPEAAPAPAPAPAATPAPKPPAPAPAPAPAAPARALFPFAAGASKWTALEVVRMSSTGGATLTGLEDGSILAEGANPPQGIHTVVVRTDLRSITGFRLELLPDPSFPASGPGRAANGNIVLSEFKVEVAPGPEAESGTPVALTDPRAEFSQEGWNVAAAIDGKNETGWAVAPRFGLPNAAVFEARKPVASAGPLTLIVRLEHNSVHAQHVIGRFRLSASTVRDPGRDLAAPLPPPAPPVDAQRVDAAIQKGIAWLRTAAPANSHVGNSDELILWTFVHAGIAESDPKFQELLKRMLEAPLERTYKVALQAMILEELDRVEHQPRIWQCAQFLVDNQCLNGQWNYGTPTDSVKGVPSVGSRPAVATASRLDAEGHRIKPRVVKRMGVRKSRDGPAEGDNSNSQYAALGLRACHDAGISLPEDTLLRAVKWWRESQHPDEVKENGYGGIKGWNYTNPARDPRPAYPAMTAGGASSLILYDYILGRDWKKDSFVKGGMNWLSSHFGVDANYYYLYGLERAGVLYGTETFGRHDWYRLGARFILDNQTPAGVWGNPGAQKADEQASNTWSTCFSILFLKRATRPLVASEDARGTPVRK